MRKYILIFIIFILGINNVFAFESKVYDFSSILKDKEENKLNININKYANKNDINTAIITIKHTNYDMDTYIEKFINKYGVTGDAVLLIYNTELNNYDIYTIGNKDKYYNSKNIKGFIKEVNGNEDYYLVFTKFLKNNKNYSMLDIKDILLAFALSILLTFITALIISPKKVKNKIIECTSLDIKYIDEKFIRTDTKTMNKSISKKNKTR